jgi:hypothetical protein
MTTHLDEANEFLLAGGVISAKFETADTTVTGSICRPPEVQQQREIDTGKPKFWEDGKPRQQIVVHLQTTSRDPEIEDDDGIRALYVRGNMLRAVREAVRKAGAKLEVGGVLTVTYTSDGERKAAGFNPPKLYTAAYVPAAQAAVADALGDPAPAAPAAVAAVTRPPSVPADQWDALPQHAKEALAAALPQF